MRVVGRGGRGGHVGFPGEKVFEGLAFGGREPLEWRKGGHGCGAVSGRDAAKGGEGATYELLAGRGEGCVLLHGKVELLALGAGSCGAGRGGG